MPGLDLPTALLADEAELIRGASVFLVTAFVLVAALVGVGFAILFRRRGAGRGLAGGRRGAGGAGGRELELRAGGLLLRADDALRSAEDELGFAVAQFGADSTREFAESLANARADVMEAFRLRQALDDSTPDSDRQRREWQLQIVANCERALEALARHDQTFSRLRRAEANAGEELDELRRRLAATEPHLLEAQETLDRLAANYASASFGQVSGNVTAARELIRSSTKTADGVAVGISASGVNSVTGGLDEARLELHRAGLLLDAIRSTANHLDETAAARDGLVASSGTVIAEAKKERDTPPDPASGAALLHAVDGLERTVATVAAELLPDPVTQLDELGSAFAALDTALASARNQQQRLSHAREALAGTLLSARSQISVVHDYIGARGAGVQARTRLAEAERQLMLAENESDPVEALDTARRAVTHARDADALARYDALGR